MVRADYSLPRKEWPMNRRSPGCFDWCRRPLALLPLVVVSMAVMGCESGNRGPIETTYLVSLEQSDQIDYKIAWESAIALSAEGQAATIYPYDDYVLAAETGRNILTALTTRDGRAAWEYPVGASLEHLRGVTRLDNEILASTQSDLYFLDVATGRLRQQQRYAPKDAALTAGVVFGPFLIYGTSDGRIVYHHLGVGLMKTAYRLETAQSITHPPLVLGNEFAVITQSGGIHLMDGANNSRIWSAAVRDPVKATPAIDDFAIYVAGTDQSLWAFRIADGKLVWRFRCQQPLTDDPKLIDGVIYQAEPGRGLHAIDSTTGVEKWLSPDVRGGTVVARKNGQLIVWDKDDSRGATGSTFYRLLERDGSVLGKAYCPSISIVESDRIENGTIYGMSRSGRIIKLIP